MKKKYIIKVCGTTTYVNDVKYTTPLPLYGEKLPSRCVVESVTFSKSNPMSFFDPSFAHAMADGIKVIMAICLEVVDTWKD